MAIKSNSTFGRQSVITSPSPATVAAGHSVPTQTTAVDVLTWGDNNLLNTGGWFKVRLTFALKGGQTVLDNISNIAQGQSGPVCAVHNGFLRWTTAHQETPRLICWPSIVPLKRQGTEFFFNEDGEPLFQKNSGLHLFWCPPISEGLTDEEQAVMNRFNEWTSNKGGGIPNFTEGDLALLAVAMEKVKANKPKINKLDAYKLLQQFQALPDSANPTFAKMKVVLPLGMTEQMIEWISAGAEAKQSGVLDLYIKDQFSMRQETGTNIVEYKYNGEGGVLTTLTNPQGEVVEEYQYNFGNILFARWNPNMSLWEPDQTRLFSQEESRRMAEKAVGDVKPRGAEIELLAERIKDLLRGANRKNKWHIRAGVVPEGPNKSCFMWDTINQYGDEARTIWEETLSLYIGKLAKPYRWGGAGEDFEQHHLNAFMGSVNSYETWMSFCIPPLVKPEASTPMPTPAKVEEPKPTEAPVAKVEGPSLSAVSAGLGMNLSLAFEMDNEVSGDDGYEW